MHIYNLFSCVVEPSKPFAYFAETDTQITNIALDPSSSQPSSSATAVAPIIVKLQYEGDRIDDLEEDKAKIGREDDDGGVVFETKEVVVCSLIPGQIMQAQVNILLKEDDQYKFTVTGGAHSVHLLGHYVLQEHADGSSEADSDASSCSGSMPAHDYGEFLLETDESLGEGLDTVSDDDDTDDSYDDADEDDEDEDEDLDESRIQEIGEEVEQLADEEKTAAAVAASKAVVNASNKQHAPSKKRPADSEADGEEAVADVSMATSEGKGDAKLSKNQRKKLAKKLKQADGSAVGIEAQPASAPAATKQAGDKDKQEKLDKKTAASAVSAGDKKQSSKSKTAVKLPSGLEYTETKAGEGAACKKGERVSMRYIGRLASGKVFDKNVKGEPFRFVLGRGEVIKGWEEGVRGMRVGAERKLVIPPALAYGARGSPPDIPANATLTFEVKLLAVGK